MRIAIIPMLLLAPAALGQATAHDGTWFGRMRCDAIPNMTNSPLNSPLTMTVTGGAARYTRDVQTVSGQVAGRPEYGTGRIGADGSVTLEGTTSAAGGSSWNFTARYSGRISGSTLTLQGTQDGTVRTVPHQRPCTITLRKDGG